MAPLPFSQAWKNERGKHEAWRHNENFVLDWILRNSPAGNYEELNWFLPHLEFQWKAAYFSECCWWYPKNKTKIREVIIHMYTDAMFILQRLEIKWYSNFLLGHSKWTPLLPAWSEKKICRRRLYKEWQTNEKKMVYIYILYERKP